MREETLKLFIQNLNDFKPFVFTKFGDGEAICMSGQFKDGDINCDKQPYSKELGKKLLASAYFLSKQKNVFIGEWNYDGYADVLSDLFQDLNFNYVDYETILHTENSPLDLLGEFYGALSASPLRIVYICPRFLTRAANYFGASPVFISQPFDITQTTVNIGKYDIYLYSAGMASKVLIHELLGKYPSTTHIDIGSGLDNIFYGNTRAKQLPFNESSTYRSIFR